MQNDAETGIAETGKMKHRQLVLFCKQTHPRRWYDLLIQHETTLMIKQITHTMYINKINSALLREIHGVPTTAMTTDPSVLASQQQPL